MEQIERTGQIENKMTRKSRLLRRFTVIYRCSFLVWTLAFLIDFFIRVAPNDLTFYPFDWPWLVVIWVSPFVGLLLAFPSAVAFTLAAWVLGYR